MCKSYAFDFKGMQTNTGWLTAVLHSKTEEITGDIAVVIQDVADFKIINVSWKHT